MSGLDKVAEKMSVILPLHHRTKKQLEANGLWPLSSRLSFIDPVGYLDMTALETNAAVIATDSGGVQKEAYFQGVPCITLREETEWVELVDAGWNRLVPPGREDVADAILGAVGSKGEDVRSYGSGGSARNILEKLL